MSWISNYLSNTLVTGTAWADTITNYGIGNVTIVGGKGNDSIDNHNYSGNLYWYNYGDGNDTINGFTSNDVLKINGWSYSTMVSGNDFVVNVGSGSIILKNAAQTTINIVNQWGSLDTYSKSKVLYGTDTPDLLNISVANTTVFGYAGNDTIYNTSNGSQIYGGDGHDDIISSGNNVGISGGNGADSILSSGNNGLFIGNNGNDTIYIQGKGNKLDGGQGNDIIILETGSSDNLIAYENGDGKDSIIGFNATSTLSIGGSSYSTKKSGDNIIVTVGKGKISLMGAASLSNVNITSDYLNVTNSTKSPVTVGSAVKIVNASSRTKAVKITGNALANSIVGGSKNDSLYGGSGNDSILGGKGNDKLYGQSGNDKLYGGSGNDTLIGGKGNDSLWGDAGKDTFIYSSGDGKDVIYGFDNNDMLKITGKFSASYSKSKGEVYFKVDSTSKAITLKNFTATSFNVNGDTYKISGTKLIRN